MGSMFILQQMLGVARRYATETFVENGETFEYCPFCDTPVSMRRKICSGCGATRESQAVTDVIHDMWTIVKWIWIVAAIMLVVLCLILSANG